MLFEYNLDKNVNTVSALELKQLLTHLSAVPNVCFRFRVVGEMWVTHFMHVISVKEKAVLLFNQTETKYYLVSLNNMMQFEIDARFQNFQPHFHYNVTPSTELDN